MNDDVVKELTKIRSKIDEMLLKEDESAVDALVSVWRQRDSLLKELCSSRQSLIEHQALLEQELKLTNAWLKQVQQQNIQVGKSLLKSSRNQKAIRSYQG